MLFTYLYKYLCTAGSQAVKRQRQLSSYAANPVAALDPSCPQPSTLPTLQRQYPELYAIINYLEYATLPIEDSHARSILLSIDSFYLNEGGILCHLWTPGKRHVKSLMSKVVTPASLRHKISVACHDDPIAGHLGIFKTYEKVRSRQRTLVQIVHSLRDEEVPTWKAQGTVTSHTSRRSI